VTLDNLRYIKGQIIFYKKEIESVKVRREELSVEMVQKGMDTELATSIMGLDEIREQHYRSLVKHLEDLILILETMANIPTKDRLPREPKNDDHRPSPVG